MVGRLVQSENPKKLSKISQVESTGIFHTSDIFLKSLNKAKILFQNFLCGARGRFFLGHVCVRIEVFAKIVRCVRAFSLFMSTCVR